MTFGFILLMAGLAALVAGVKGVTIADVLKGALGPDNPIFTRGTVGGAAKDDTADADIAGGGGAVDYSGGARSIVDSLAAIAAPFGTTVVSDSRPGDRTTTGNVSDHSENNANRAARDIGVQGVDALKGPPPKELDKAIVAIGRALGKDFKGGKPYVVNVNRHGFRIQIIWRVPSYGGHMGHIHVGARRIAGASSKKAPGPRR